MATLRGTPDAEIENQIPCIHQKTIVFFVFSEELDELAPLVTYIINELGSDRLYPLRPRWPNRNEC